MLDDDSRDGTGAIAAALGAEVVRPAALLPAFGPVLGKGDAMWRALSAVRAISCASSTPTRRTSARTSRPACSARSSATTGVQFVKGFYRRPFKSAAEPRRADRRRSRDGADGPPAAGGVLSRAGGGPPAAGRRVRRAPRAARADGVLHRLRRSRSACCSTSTRTSALGRRSRRSTSTSRQNRHQPLEDLAPMAEAVLGAVMARLRREAGPPRRSRAGAERPLERPPLAELRALRAAAPITARSHLRRHRGSRCTA